MPQKKTETSLSHQLRQFRVSTEAYDAIEKKRAVLSRRRGRDVSTADILRGALKIALDPRCDEWDKVLP